MDNKTPQSDGLREHLAHTPEKWSDEELRVKCAELCGWTRLEYFVVNLTSGRGLLGSHDDWQGTPPHDRDKTEDEQACAVIPNYPNDLNAMNEALALLDDDTGSAWCDYWDNLSDVTGAEKVNDWGKHWTDSRLLLHATARQVCIAFIQTLSPLSSDGSPNKKEEVPNGEPEAATVTSAQAGEFRACFESRLIVNGTQREAPAHVVYGYRDNQGRRCTQFVATCEGVGRDCNADAKLIADLLNQHAQGAALSPNHEASGSGVEDGGKEADQTIYIRANDPCARELLSRAVKWMDRLCERKDSIPHFCGDNDIDPCPLAKDIRRYLRAAMKQSTKGEGQEQ